MVDAADGNEIAFPDISLELGDYYSIEVITEGRSEEHTSELQSLTNLVCRLLLEKKKKKKINTLSFTSLNITIVEHQL